MHRMPTIAAVVAVAAVVGAVPLAAVAQTWDTNTQPTLSQISARNVQAKHGAVSPIWRLTPPPTITPGAAGSVTVANTIGGISPRAGDIIDVEVRRVVPWAKTAKAVAKALPVVGNAIAIAEILEAIRCREGVGGGAECDDGQAEAPQTMYSTGGVLQCYQTGGVNIDISGSALTPGAACGGVASKMDGCSYTNPGAWTSVVSYQVQSATASVCTLKGSKTFTYVGGGTTTINFTDVTTPITTASVVQCPVINVAGQDVIPLKGPDGLCPTTIYTPATELEVEEKFIEHGDKSKAAAVVGEALQELLPIEHDPPTFLPETPVFDSRETTVKPDGSTVVRDKAWDLSSSGDPLGYRWVPKVTEKTYAPGDTIPPPGEIPAAGATVSTGGTGEPSITCGLPGTPPCKIDETGTPGFDDPFESDPKESWFRPLLDLFQDPDTADTSWSWSFALPTGCTPITVGPFAGQSVEVNLCTYQPMIHDLMSLVWVGATIWICVGMVGRTLGGS